MTRTWNEIATELCDPEREIDSDYRAAKALSTVFPAYDEFDLESAITDALTDLIHLCDLADIDFATRYQMARLHYGRECDENGTANHAELKEAIRRDLQ